MDQRRPNGNPPDWTPSGVHPPNESLGGYAHVGSSAPMGRALSPVVPGNQFFSGPMAQVGGSQPQPRSGSPVMGPDHKFHVEDAKMPQPQSPVKHTDGAVPIRPSRQDLEPSILKRADVK